ncbi:Manganese/iron superoxide dismutase [Polychytrium aggregatum]|uniref:Manganese/iron superoxide dismutase n=1 Tax=Polychytrium aggregatum TaxID=110093 RepID=UPI0022FE12AA|nr:Manganese/iron superoxide dismutase [Polychytrium aggregatum]KAI9202961.1 Manganese/iron superoxide dismutase [Polychytrium aggregatum]
MIFRSAVAKLASRPSVLSVAARNKHTLPDLPYDYNALEPFISAEIMQLHHSKHHQAYITNLNIAEEKLHEASVKSDLTTQIALQPALKFNGGGHINHSIFWTNLAPQSCGGGDLSKGPLLDAINRDFGSLEAFQKNFALQAAAVQGSGWGWLGYNKGTKKLEIATTANQDPLTALVPLLGVDVWEHAYYLQYKNVRPDYLKAIWSVVNWKDVSERFGKASN